MFSGRHFSSLLAEDVSESELDGHFEINYD